LLAGLFTLGGAEELPATGVKIAKGEASLSVILGCKSGAICWCDEGAANLVKLFCEVTFPIMMTLAELYFYWYLCSSVQFLNFLPTPF
jgi:hypothetical protein